MLNGYKFRQLVETTPAGEPLVIDSDLVLQHGSAEIALPDNMTVNGSVNLDYSANLNSLPESLVITGSLSIRSCVNLKELPNNLHVAGDLTAPDCWKLASIAENLAVSGNLDFSRCSMLRAIPAPLLAVIRSYAKFCDCTSLRTIPAYSRAGVIDLRGCTSIVRLSSHLCVRELMLDAMPRLCFSKRVVEDCARASCNKTARITDLSMLNQDCKEYLYTNYHACVTLLKYPELTTLLQLEQLTKAKELEALLSTYTKPHHRQL